MLSLIIVFCLLLLPIVTTDVVQAALDPNIYIQSGSNTTSTSGSTVTVDPGITIDLHSQSNVTGAKVMISSGFVSGDTLTHASGSFDATTGVLTFSGTYTASEIETIFRAVTFTPKNSSTDTASRTIVFTLGSGLSFNGHFYEVISASSGIDWYNAKTAAADKKLFGLQGYLVTLTSADENTFIKSRLSQNSWIGATDNKTAATAADHDGFITSNSSSTTNPDEGNWYWMTGPESGTKFWIGSSEGSAVDGKFENWEDGEPNNYNHPNSNGEHFGQYYNGSGRWNDLTGSSTQTSYIVEYGGMTGDPSVTISSSKTVTINSATLSYDANGGSGTPTAAATYRTGTELSLAGNSSGLSRSGYTFMGWTAASDGTGTLYQDGNSYTLNENTTFYAQWLKIASSAPASAPDYFSGASAALIDPNFVVDGMPIKSIVVSINNFVPGDTLHFTDTAEIKSSYSDGYLTLSSNSGNPVAADSFQAAIRSITFSATHSSGIRTFSYSVVPDKTETTTLKYNAANQHFYELVDLGTTPANYSTWSEAKTAAAKRTHNGKKGYLVTLTTLAEDELVKSIMDSNIGASAGASAWMGFRNFSTSGDWRWDDGPEAGTAFYSGYYSTSTGAHINNQYTRWATGEPNSSAAINLAFGTYWMGGTYNGVANSGAWDDNSNGSALRYYLVEYGGLSGDALTTTSSLNVTITRSVEYELNGGTNPAGTQSLFAMNNQSAITLPIPTRENYLFDGWFEQASFTGSAVTAIPAGTTSNVKYYAKWSHYNVVSFDSNGGSSVADQQVIDNTTVKRPDNPIRIGYRFVNWFTTGQLDTTYDFSTPVNAPATLFAKWILNQYVVTFNSNGGSFVTPQNVTYNTVVPKPAAPVKTGYDFAGWYSNSSLDKLYDFTSPVTGAKTLYAKWIRKDYVVTFEENGGSSVDNKIVSYLDLVDVPASPKREGYTFKGWYTNSALTTPFDFDNMQLTGNLTLYARWEANALINFDTHYGSNVAGQGKTSPDSATKPVDPVRPGYRFEGWYTAEDYKSEYSFGETETAETWVYAKWIKNTYMLSFVTGNETSVAAQAVDYGDKGSVPAEPIREGYAFIGWSTSEGDLQAWNFSLNRVYGNTILYACYAPDNFTFEYRDATGQLLSLAKPLSNEDGVATPPRQFKNGYRFLDWHQNYDKTAQRFVMTPVFQPINVDIRGDEIVPSLANVFEAVPFSESELENEVSVRLDFDLLDGPSVAGEDKTAFDTQAKSVLPEGAISALYFDISLYRVINATAEKLTELDAPLEVSFVVPLAYRNRFFELIRVHTSGSDTVAEAIPYTYTSSNHTITFNTDRFSTYGLAYSSASAYRITDQDEDDSHTSSNADVTMIANTTEMADGKISLDGSMLSPGGQSKRQDQEAASPDHPDASLSDHPTVISSPNAGTKGLQSTDQPANAVSKVRSDRLSRLWLSGAVLFGLLLWGFLWLIVARHKRKS